MYRFSWMILVAAAACGGGSGGGGGGDDAPGPDASPSEPLVEGLPASQYYGKFAYETTKTGVNGAAAFPANAAGNNAFLAHFFLMPNKAYALFYEEGQGEVTPTGFSLNTQSSTRKKRSGTWRIDGAQLVLDGFLRCTGLTINERASLRCTLEQTIVSPVAQGRAGTFRQMIGAASPDDSEFAGYVP